MAFLLKIEGPSSTATADVENSPFHISCGLSLSERPVLVLRQIVLRVRIARVNESVISFYDLNYLAALEEVVQLMTISVLTILQHITILLPTDKKKSKSLMTIYRRDAPSLATRYRNRSWLDPRLALRQSSIHGKGLVATQSFRVDEVVIVFGGTLFSKEDIAAGKANNRTLTQIDEELWLGDPANHPLGEDYFLNHSCEPNLWIADDVTLTARRNIDPGDEVTMDYVTHFADPAWTMKNTCNCGAPLCRRVITGRDWTLKGLQERYRGHFTPLLNKRITRLQGSD